MATYSAISCAEEENTRTEDRQLTSWTASVQVRLSAVDLSAFATDVLGNRREWPHGSEPIKPRAESISVSTPGGAATTIGQSMIYGDALATINYNSEVNDIVSEDIEPAVDVVRLDHRQFRWSDADGDPLQESEAPGFTRRTLALVRRYEEFPKPLPIELLDLVGKCNDSPHVSTLLGVTFPTATLLYMPPRLSHTITTAGADGVSMELKFMYRPETWNKYYRSSTDTYEEIYHPGGGVVKTIPEADFSAFLT